MEVHIIHSTNIFLNLALEEELFATLPANGRRLLIWKNDPAVVMGRFQNPWVECNLAKMAADGVALARRQSGGGTVYHDLGNMNISFMDWNESYSKERNNECLVKTLNDFGHDALASGRSDIQIRKAGGNRKVSGAAFKKKKDRSFHHCTMLLSADLDLLDQYLMPKFNQEQMRTKAIASVRSKVANTNIPEQDFIASVIANFERGHGQKAKLIEWKENDVAKRLASAPKFLEHLRSWEWVFGETPLFQTSAAKGSWSMEVAAKKGKLRELELFHESLHPSFLEAAGQALKDCPLKLSDVALRLEGLPGAQLYRAELALLQELFREFFAVDFKEFKGF